MDKAHKWTDLELERLEKEVKTVYGQALEDCKKQLSKALEKMNSLPADATPQQRMIAANQYDRLKNLEKQMTLTINNANKEAMAITQKSWANTYAQNYNGIAQSIEYQTKGQAVLPILDKKAINKIIAKEITPFTKLALDDITDKAQVMRNLTNQLTQGLATGESNQSIAKRIQKTIESDYSRAIKIARTETTRVENNGRMDACKKAQDMGIEQTKIWVATTDDRTRDAHIDADGQEVPIDEPFIVDGEELQYPGDDAGSPENVINCRCTFVTQIKGFERR